jgi:hypothetical protein
MPVDTALRSEIEKQIMGGDVKIADMMGTTSYMVGKRTFAYWVADGLVVKLPDQERQSLIDRRQGAAFQSAQGRGGFGEWTRLHIEKKADVEHVVAAVKTAYDYVKGGAGGVARAAAQRKKDAPKGQTVRKPKQPKGKGKAKGKAK